MNKYLWVEREKYKLFFKHFWLFSRRFYLFIYFWAKTEKINDAGLLPKPAASLQISVQLNFLIIRLVKVQFFKNFASFLRSVSALSLTFIALSLQERSVNSIPLFAILMAISSRVLLLLLFFSSSAFLTLSLYEDQVGLMDWFAYLSLPFSSVFLFDSVNWLSFW